MPSALDALADAALLQSSAVSLEWGDGDEAAGQATSARGKSSVSVTGEGKKEAKERVGGDDGRAAVVDGGRIAKDEPPRDGFPAAPAAAERDDQRGTGLSVAGRKKLPSSERTGVSAAQLACNYERARRLAAEVGHRDVDGEVTRCPCGSSNYEGFMLACETCGVWQHGKCMGILRANKAPGTYHCEVCRPDLIRKHCIVHPRYQTLGIQAPPQAPRAAESFPIASSSSVSSSNTESANTGCGGRDGDGGKRGVLPSRSNSSSSSSVGGRNGLGLMDAAAGVHRSDSGVTAETPTRTDPHAFGSSSSSHRQPMSLYHTLKEDAASVRETADTATVAAESTAPPDAKTPTASSSPRALKQPSPHTSPVRSLVSASNDDSMHSMSVVSPKSPANGLSREERKLQQIMRHIERMEARQERLERKKKRLTEEGPNALTSAAKRARSEAASPAVPNGTGGKRNASIADGLSLSGEDDADREQQCYSPPPSGRALTSRSSRKGARSDASGNGSRAPSPPAASASSSWPMTHARISAEDLALRVPYQAIVSSSIVGDIYVTSPPLHTERSYESAGVRSSGSGGSHELLAAAADGLQPRSNTVTGEFSVFRGIRPAPLRSPRGGGFLPSNKSDTPPSARLGKKAWLLQQHYQSQLEQQAGAMDASASCDSLQEHLENIRAQLATKTAADSNGLLPLKKKMVAAFQTSTRSQPRSPSVPSEAGEHGSPREHTVEEPSATTSTTMPPSDHRTAG
ncbi:hypothetical protein CDCA_CDCA08G2458 [Cyanidium caldarium]|uniref:Zinc finger PHD-type domain-containing protein n=1 Tax=Cyanidium caldarium TaxID=2771 RepID=A0AAV9IXA5_CYACA|nr:hypothetical protein CDCA_CDCA08G2458 [Cyanidium caldarium]